MDIAHARWDHERPSHQREQRPGTVELSAAAAPLHRACDEEDAADDESEVADSLREGSVALAVTRQHLRDGMHLQRRKAYMEVMGI